MGAVRDRLVASDATNWPSWEEIQEPAPGEPCKTCGFSVGDFDVMADARGHIQTPRSFKRENELRIKFGMRALTYREFLRGMK